MAVGWIYILTNKSMPGLVKVGQTANNPDARALELYTTGVPTPFEVQYKGLYDDYAALERRVHTALSQVRHSNGREFFRIAVEDVIVKVRELSGTALKEEINYLTPAQLRQAEARAAKEAIRQQQERFAREAAQKQLVAENERITRQRESYVRIKVKHSRSVADRYVFTPIGLLLLGALAFALGPIGWIAVPVAVWWIWSKETGEQHETLVAEAATKYPFRTLDDYLGVDRSPSSEVTIDAPRPISSPKGNAPITRCPKCRQKLNVPLGKRLKINCPTCAHEWVQTT